MHPGAAENHEHVNIEIKTGGTVDKSGYKVGSTRSLLCLERQVVCDECKGHIKLIVSKIEQWRDKRDGFNEVEVFFTRKRELDSRVSSWFLRLTGRTVAEAHGQQGTKTDPTTEG